MRDLTKGLASSVTDIPFRERLSVRQASMALVVAFFLGLIFTGIQLVWDLRNERKHLGESTEQAVRSIQKSATMAAYELDPALGESVLSGLIVFSSVRGAAIYDNFGDVIASSQRVGYESYEHEHDSLLARLIVGDIAVIEKELIWPDGNRQVGILSVDTDIEYLAHDFKERFWLLLASGLLRNFILATTLILIFQVFLTRPLSRAAAAIANGAGPAAFAEVGLRQDELGIVFRSLQNYLTELENKNREIEVSEEKYRRLVEISKEKIVIYSHNADGVFTYLSPSVEDVLGYAPEDLRVNYQLIFTDNPINKKAINYTEQSLLGIKQAPYEVEVLHADKSYRVLAISEAPVFDDFGSVVAVEGFATDITEMKFVEESLNQYADELENKTRQLEEIIWGTDAGTWHWNLTTGEMTINQRWVDILGYTSAELTPLNLEKWRSLCHPEDLVRVNQQLNDLSENHSESFECELRMRHRCGQWIWVQDRGKVVERQPTGEPLRMSGIRMDISRAKIAEGKLKASLKRNELILASTGDGVLGVDLDGHTTFMNQAVQRMTGWTEEDLIGKNQHEMLHHSHADGSKYLAEECKGLRALKEGVGQTVSDQVFWRKDGTPFPVEYVINPVSVDGRVSGAVVTFRDITERLKSEQKIREMALTDSLTGLANRNDFIRFLERSLASAKRDGAAFGLFMLDLDLFKPINDTYGHPVGDKVLCEVAERLRVVCRESDMAARLGGDEFAIIMTSLGDESEYCIPAKRIISELTRPMTIDGHELVLGVSIGVAIYPEDATDNESLISLADSALYQAKRIGGNKFVKWHPASNDEFDEQH